jgi:hypothetical protein
VQEAGRKAEVDAPKPETDGRKHAEVHKVMERQRRMNLRHSLDRLRAVLGLSSDSVEVHVLTSALACIQKLEQEFKCITEETERVRALQG